MNPALTLKVIDINGAESTIQNGGFTSATEMNVASDGIQKVRIEAPSSPVGGWVRGMIFDS